MEHTSRQTILGSMEWPGTPGHSRLMRALADRTKNPDDLEAVCRADLSALEGILDNEEYQERARQTLIEHICRQGRNNANLTLLEEIAMRGTDEDFIGTVILSRSRGCEAGCNFARLHRNPDWMGTEPSIPLLKGLQVHLIEWEEIPGEPAILVAMDPRMAREGVNHPGAPSETGRRLEEIARWHGATDCLWYPITQGGER